MANFINSLSALRAKEEDGELLKDQTNCVPDEEQMQDEVANLVPREEAPFDFYPFPVPFNYIAPGNNVGRSGQCDLMCPHQRCDRSYASPERYMSHCLTRHDDDEDFKVAAVENDENINNANEAVQNNGDANQRGREDNASNNNNNNNNNNNDDDEENNNDNNNNGGGDDNHGKDWRQRKRARKRTDAVAAVINEKMQRKRKREKAKKKKNSNVSKKKKSRNDATISLPVPAPGYSTTVTISSSINRSDGDGGVGGGGGGGGGGGRNSYRSDSSSSSSDSSPFGSSEESTENESSLYSHAHNEDCIGSSEDDDEASVEAVVAVDADIEEEQHEADDLKRALTATEMCPIYGRFPPHRTLNHDQIPLNDYTSSKMTFVPTGAEVISADRRGQGATGRRIATMHVLMAAKAASEANRKLVRVLVIFKGEHGASKRARELEAKSYHPLVRDTVTFQTNAWADKDTQKAFMKMYSTFVEPLNGEPCLLLQDNLSSQNTPGFYRLAGKANTLVWNGPPNMTNVWQPIDARLGYMLKEKANKHMRDFIETESVKHPGKKIPMKKKRIAVTHAIGKAIEYIEKEKYETVFAKFESTGCLIGVDLQGKEKIQLQGLSKKSKEEHDVEWYDKFL